MTPHHVRRRLVGLVSVVLVGLVAGCSGSAPEPTPKPSTSATPSPTSSEPGTPTQLTFGVFGTDDATEPFQTLVRRFNASSDASEVTLKTWRDRREEAAALAKGDTPDVFLVSRRDLAGLVEEQRVRPVDELLDARGVDFGDDYARDALRAFSLDDSLQCMPYGISPMVIYYNRDLVDFTKMADRGLPAPQLDENGRPPRTWSFEQFSAAAEFATRPRRGTRGLAVDPTLRGLAPFIVSGGGDLFDDDTAPTSLALSSDADVDALETVLELLRNPKVNLTPTQLEHRSALTWFEQGKLGMIAGFRDLVPQLRRVQKLDFDVMPMPVVDRSGTIGDITGLCLSADAADVGAAADFLAYAIGTDAVSTVAREGYLVPANLSVATSDEFLQEGRQPDNSRVFVQAVRDIYVPPLIRNWSDLETAVAPGLVQLVESPVLDTELIREITTQLDEESRAVLVPESASPSPSATSSGG